jgi:hypothetical protein
VPPAARALASQPPSAVVEPIKLDALTIVDDGHYYETLAQERNLPKDFVAALRS